MFPDEDGVSVQCERVCLCYRHRGDQLRLVRGIFRGQHLVADRHRVLRVHHIPRLQRYVCESVLIIVNLCVLVVLLCYVFYYIHITANF